MTDGFHNILINNTMHWIDKLNKELEELNKTKIRLEGEKRVYDDNFKKDHAEKEKKIVCDIIIILQPTSPLRKTEHKSIRFFLTKIGNNLVNLFL
jgi:CMP-N-acetylneuraminic acid synthetase